METMLIRVLLISFIFLGLVSPVLAQDLSPQESKSARKTVKNWSSAHEEWDIETLKNLYKDSLVFYTQKLPQKEALSKITEMFRPSESFKHKIISDIDLKILSNGTIKCNFTKEVTTKGKTKSYPSYLVLEKSGDKFLVCAEGDYITDKNLGFDYEDKFVYGVKNTSSMEAKSSSNTWLYVFSLGLIPGAALLLYFKKRKKETPQISEQKPVQEKVEPIIQKTTVTLTEFEINKQKGDEFERYVVGKFNRTYFTSKAWRSDKAAHGHFPEANRYPDLEFEFRHNDYSAQFAVECKYRSTYNGGFIDLGDYYKLNEYRKFEKNKQMQVYIVVGVGGNPSSPDELFIIPLPQVNSNKLHRKKLSLDYNKSINSNFFYNTELHLLT